MAGQRRKPADPSADKQGQVITSAEVGSESLDPNTGGPLSSMTTATVGEYGEEFEDYPQEWKNAFDHAARVGNTQKGCQNFADANMDKPEFAVDGA